MPEPVIPDHSLLRVIGRGAYGEVWLARNIMGSFRAVKVIWRGQFESSRPFEREFEGIQRYEPVSAASGGLVHLFHVGRNESQGYFYYVMELADPANGLEKGEDYEPRTLRSDLKRRGPLPAADCLRLATEVLSGLAQLHRFGLVHRDVKPGNIIYANGRAKLADIGLVSTGGEGKTFVGTEGYIPPEGPGSSAADLYALGMVLYQACTGFQPDRCPDVPPEWVTSGKKAALEFFEIVLKACEGQRERRYQTAAEMQADLALLQNGESVRQVRALKRRYARLRGVAVVAGVLAAGAVILGTFSAYRARLAAETRKKETALRHETQRALERTEAAEREARQALYRALLEQARATVRSGDLGQRNQSLEAIRRAATIANTAELRGAAMVALSLPDLRLRHEITQPAGATLAYLSPDFERIAFFFGSKDGEIRTKDLKVIAKLATSAKALASEAEWSGDGRFLWVRREFQSQPPTASLEVWNTAMAAKTLCLPKTTGGAAGFDALSSSILVGLDEAAVALVNLPTGEEKSRFKLDRPPRVLAIAPDGASFAASFDWPKYEVSIHSMANGKKLASRDFSAFAASIAWDPAGRWLATADRDGFVHLLDVHSGEAKLLGRHKLQGSLVRFSPDGDYLMSGGWDKEFICWDMRRLERAFSIPLDAFRMQFQQNDGNRIAVVTDSAIQFYEFERPFAVRELPVDVGPRLDFAAFSNDGRWIAASGTGGFALWPLDGHGPGTMIKDSSDARVFFSDDSQELYEYGEHESFRWKIVPPARSDLPPRLEPMPLPDPADPTSTIPFGRRILLRKAQNGTPDDPATRVPSIAGLSPDGRWLAGFEPFSFELKVVQLPGLEAVTNLTALGYVARFHFSPLGDELAVDASTGIEIFSIGKWNRLRTITNAIAMLYMPDEKSIWLTHNFREAGLHDAQTLETLLPLPLGSHPLAVRPDGCLVAVRIDGRHLVVWSIPEMRGRLKDMALDWGI